MYWLVVTIYQSIDLLMIVLSQMWRFFAKGHVIIF